MAGERLYSEFSDDKGTDWRVSIYDTNVTWNAANKASFVLGAEGFVIKYSGNNEQQHQPIIGSSVEFTLYEETADHTQTLDLLYSFAEGRLLLEIYKDPDGDNDLYWRGVILAEQIERMDEPTPTPVRISATDDLGNLKDVQFSDSAGDVGAGLNVKNQVIRCLAGMRTYSRWADGEVILRYLNDTELHATDDDTDPLAEIIAQTPVKVLEDGTTEAHSCFDILASLATAFNARVFLANGYVWFWPINAYQRVADAEVLGSKVKQYDKDGGAVSFGSLDQVAFNNAVNQEEGVDYEKLAGHTFTHLPPVKFVERTRRFDGNQYVVRGNDDTIVTSGVNITLADTDATYEVGTKFRISGFVNFQVSPDASFDFGLPASRVKIELEMEINADAKYYQPEEWTTDSADRYVLELATFDRSNGTNTNAAYSFITDALPTEEDGLDVTAVVKFFNLEGTNVTSSYTSDDFFLDFGVEVVDDNGANGDLKTYRSTVTGDNLVTVDQGECLFGDNIAFSAQGKLYGLDGSLNRVENEWKTSQTAGPLALHRLGVQEALARQKFATKVHRGTVYGLIEMWQTMEESSEFYVPFEISTVMNRRESTVERFKIAFDSGSITSADDPPRSLGGERGGYRDMLVVNASAHTQQVQQAKRTAGGSPLTPITGRTLSNPSSDFDQAFPVREVAHTAGSTFTIGEKSTGSMFMNSYSGANGFGTIYLPPVESSEGRMLRFKSDDSISANGYYIVRPDTTDAAAGTEIDGSASFIMNRDYDGIAVLCHASQWYVIQRKAK